MSYSLNNKNIKSIYITSSCHELLTATFFSPANIFSVFYSVTSLRKITLEITVLLLGSYFFKIKNYFLYCVWISF